MALKNPPHPGDFIRTEIIEAAGLNVTSAAAVLCVPRSALSNLVHGKVKLSAGMSQRLEKAFGVRTATLMRMQAAYNTATVPHRKRPL